MGHITTTTLNRGRSDHCPITLQDNNVDFGPKPFKIFDVRLENKDIEALIAESWNKNVGGTRLDYIFRNKLKNVKEALRKWSKTQYGDVDNEIDLAKKITLELEYKVESSDLTEAEKSSWLDARCLWLKKGKEKTLMLEQKANAKWASEGDDNSKFFHSLIKRKHNKNNIRGLNIDGSWQENPSVIKGAVFGFFKRLFE
ncbi:uncharacterized protein [Rutidosis leptorrhynchoides]|uniref:uncharacterized protein n=1 Tax=Rutidosis leptorrhynchoides TaxID=125765 RepID=UPI003A9969B0